MVKERFLPKSKENPVVAEIIGYTTQLQQLKPAELQAEFFRTINDHPTLQEDAEDLRKAYGNMAHVHEKQTRKLSKAPYEVHVLRVTLIAMKLMNMLEIPITTEGVKAALKHDMVEDGKKKGITINTIAEQSGPVVAVMVDALTRHEEEGQVIDHKKAAKKVIKAHNDGVKNVQVIKVADRTDNVRDQPGVQRPPRHEHVLIFTGAYRESDYGKWQKTKWRTRLVFSGIVAKGEPKLKKVLKGSIRETQNEIKSRPRKSIRRK